MSIFFSVFLRTLGFLFASLLFVLTIIGISSYLNYNSITKYDLFRGNAESENLLYLLNLNGPIIESNNSINNLLHYNFISPEKIEQELNEIIQLRPKILIVSINSPGGTVSASNKLYESFVSFKEKTQIEIIFHTSELLASGGYWSSLAGDKIFASYGSIIGSIGVRGPDWFYFNKPKQISSGFLGQSIEVEKEIEIFSTSAGKSKDLFNIYRKPTQEELDHLQNMVSQINDDFTQLVSKNRKLEKKIVENEIGGLIFNSLQAKNNFLIDDEISLIELIELKVKEYNFKDYKVYKKIKQNVSLFNRLFEISIFEKTNVNINNLSLCNRIKTNISSILSYSSIGC